jgi:hypothetical protein
MAVEILHKRTATPGSTPGLGDLVLGELALNTYEGRAFFKKDGAGGPVVVELLTGTPGGVQVYEITLDFGDEPLDSHFFQINSITVATGKKVTVTASGADGDELEMDMLTGAAHVSSTDTIDLYVNSSPGPVAGLRNLILTIL